MSDETSTDEAPSKISGFDQKIAPDFAIIHQYLKDFSFENPATPYYQPSTDAAPTVQVQIDVTAKNLQENLFEVALHVDFKTRDGDQTIYMGELIYAGLAQVGNLPAEDIEPYLMIEGPRTLFPFARAIVANAVRDGGFPTLTLAPFDFVQLYNKRLKNRADENTATPSSDTPES